MAILLDITRRISLVALTLMVVMALIYFPYSTDLPLSAAEQSDLQKYYATAYQKEETGAEENSDYVRGEGCGREGGRPGKYSSFCQGF